MGLFRSAPKGERPSDTDVQAAADALNTGDPAPADALVEKSGDYGRETAMRVMASAALPLDPTP